MSKGIKEISVKELQAWQSNAEDFLLIDVREPFEKEIADIGGELVPTSTVDKVLNKFPVDKRIVIYCRSGKRSANVVRFIEGVTGQDNLYNLQGGILEWADQIDNSIEKY